MVQDKRWPEVVALFAQDHAEEPNVMELPFPSRNPWIVEQVALWLTLGQIPGLTHARFSPEHVKQGGEQAGSDKNEIVYHYFGIDKAVVLKGIEKAAFLLGTIKKQGW
jgi:hypothetical protein